MATEFTATCAMNGGNGPNSYSRNSSFQGAGVESAKVLIREAIFEHLDIYQIVSHSYSPPKPFTIADLGCSVGPNTFFVVQNIIDSIKNKYYSDSDKVNDSLEFQVFFNDLVSNDFNILFQSLPSDQQYFAAGIPGSFKRRLFPKSSLHFVHSSYALHWLSSIPKELVDKNSTAYNKGRIYWSRAPEEVVETYRTQYVKEMESFLVARAEEIVGGGIMALLLPCLPQGVSPSECNVTTLIELLGDCLIDMVKLGLIGEDKVDSFNMPNFFATPEEISYLIERNGSFIIEKMEKMARPPQRATSFSIPKVVAHIRATVEGIISNHFGGAILDELFDRFSRKIVDVSLYSPSSGYKNTIDVFFLLKRKIA